MRKVEFDRMQEVRSMMMAVACAASTDDERPDMNGVGLEVFDGELHARATNDEWAMRVRRTPVYADEGFKVLVPLSHVKRLVALIGDGIGHLRMMHEKDHVRFEVEKIGQLDLFTGGVAAVPFVDIDSVWPTSAALPMEAVGFQSGIMARLEKAFGYLAEKPTLRFAFHGDEHPIVVTCEEKEYADALLMPCTLDREDADEEDRQHKLFPESTADRVKEAIDGVRNAVPGAEVTISSSGRSVKLKGKSNPKVIAAMLHGAAVKKGATAKKKKAK